MARLLRIVETEFQSYFADEGDLVVTFARSFYKRLVDYSYISLRILLHSGVLVIHDHRSPLLPIAIILKKKIRIGYDGLYTDLVRLNPSYIYQNTSCLKRIIIRFFVEKILNLEYDNSCLKIENLRSKDNTCSSGQDIVVIVDQNEFPYVQEFDKSNAFYFVHPRKSDRINENWKYVTITRENILSFIVQNHDKIACVVGMYSTVLVVAKQLAIKVIIINTTSRLDYAEQCKKIIKGNLSELRIC
jgi:hypothetical protein